MLTDWQITDYNLVHPLNPDHVQPVTVDLTLGNKFAWVGTRDTHIVVGRDTPEYDYHGFTAHALRPRDFCLFQTAETITLPMDIAGKFEGKSSLGRIGLMTHVTAGFIDPGFHGILTLEVYNCGPLTLVLRPGIKIGQVSFTLLGAIPERTYGHPELGSHYQDADTVQGGRFDAA